MPDDTPNTETALVVAEVAEKLRTAKKDKENR
jgi:hypothetical protein